MSSSQLNRKAYESKEIYVYPEEDERLSFVRADMREENGYEAPSTDSLHFQQFTLSKLMTEGTREDVANFPKSTAVNRTEVYTEGASVLNIGFESVLSFEIQKGAFKYDETRFVGDTKYSRPHQGEKALGEGEQVTRIQTQCVTNCSVFILINKERTKMVFAHLDKHNVEDGSGESPLQQVLNKMVKDSDEFVGGVLFASCETSETEENAYSRLRKRANPSNTVRIRREANCDAHPCIAIDSDLNLTVESVRMKGGKLKKGTIKGSLLTGVFGEKDCPKDDTGSKCILV